MGSPVIGIDLGTANSCVAVVKDGRAVILSDGSDTTIPSCLGFKAGKELVGLAARRQALTDPSNTVTGVKRLMGHAYGSAEVQTARQHVAYAIRPSPLGSVMLEVGGRQLTPVQVSARILQRVKEVAEAGLGETVTLAVISVPAHFNDVQRKATKLAAEYAGLEVIRLINEPTAAAFAYGYRKGQDFTLAVYDFGGGTFDITVMMARGDRFEVVATDGDSYLGGADLDVAIAHWLEQEFEAEHGQDLKHDQTALLRVLEAAERAKVELSDVEETRIDLPFLTQLADGTRPDFSRTFSRAKLEELTRPIVQRTLDLSRRCLEEASLPLNAIEEVLLVGGQTRMPSVRDAVRDLFGTEPRRDINPDEVVAMGAALFGYSLHAESFRQEAAEAAEEECEIALRGHEVARRVVDEIRRLKTSVADLPELKARIEALLAATQGEDDAELPTPSMLPAPSTVPERRWWQEANLPGSLERLRDELNDVSFSAQSAIVELAEEIREGARARSAGTDPAIEELSKQLSGQLSQNLSRHLEAAREASIAAEGHLEEAQEHAQARKVELVDVTSLALGISSAGDFFTVLIEQNTSVPVERTRIFTTDQDGQAEVEIKVRQGRASKASRNQLLGGFVLEGIPPAERMKPKIEVTFHIDEDGILSVSARDSESGAAHGLRIEDPLGLQQAKREDQERAELPPHEPS